MGDMFVSSALCNVVGRQDVLEEHISVSYASKELMSNMKRALQIDTYRGVFLWMYEITISHSKLAI
jgi:hypothetical protein